MDEADLRVVTLNCDLAFMCAEVLAILESREHGREVIEFNVVDVTVDLDDRTVTIQSVLDVDVADVEMSIDRFVEVASPLAESRSAAQRDR